MWVIFKEIFQLTLMFCLIVLNICFLISRDIDHKAGSMEGGRSLSHAKAVV